MLNTRKGFHRRQLFLWINWCPSIPLFLRSRTASTMTLFRRWHDGQISDNILFGFKSKAIHLWVVSNNERPLILIFIELKRARNTELISGMHGIMWVIIILFVWQLVRYIELCVGLWRLLRYVIFFTQVETIIICSLLKLIRYHLILLFIVFICTNITFLKSQFLLFFFKHRVLHYFCDFLLIFILNLFRRIVNL